MCDAGNYTSVASLTISLNLFAASIQKYAVGCKEKASFDFVPPAVSCEPSGRVPLVSSKNSCLYLVFVF